MSTRMAYRPAVGGGSPTARLVHDLRAPLTVIRGLCESLGRGPAGESTVAGLRLIDAEVERLAVGLQRLAVADADRQRIREGDRSAAAGPSDACDLGALVHAVRDRFRWAADERGITLVVSAPHSLVVRADRWAIGRAVDNLVGNALRHCARDGAIRLGLLVRGGWVHLSVHDDGPGVAPADREMIFRPGCRGSAPRGPGKGLGLAIASEIARDHGGSLVLDRTATGARFRLVLPRIEEVAGAR